MEAPYSLGVIEPKKALIILVNSQLCLEFFDSHTVSFLVLVLVGSGGGNFEVDLANITG